MKIPHNVIGRTQTPTNVIRGEFQAPAVDFSTLTAGINRFVAGIQERRTQQQNFELEQDLARRQIADLLDVQERTRNVPEDLTDFTLRYNKEKEAADEKYLKDVAAKGYGEEVVQRARLALIKQRESLVRQIGNFEETALGAKRAVATRALIAQSKDLLLANPRALPQVEASLAPLLNDPNRTDAERLSIDMSLKEMREQARNTEARLFPEETKAAIAQARKPGGAIAPLVSAVVKLAKENSWSAEDLLTVISFETAGTFDPWVKGPTTQWGEHRGLIQWGEPQRKEYGITKDMPVEKQVEAIGRYLKKNGVKPGDGIQRIYNAINAGNADIGNRSDRHNGGTPGTSEDKVRMQMGAHREKARALLPKYADVPEIELQQMERLADGAITEKQLANRATVKEAYDNEEAMWLAGEKPPVPLTDETLAKAYDPAEVKQLRENLEAAKRSGVLIKEFATKPNQLIDLHLVGAKPVAGDPAFLVKQKHYEALERAARHVKALRQSDPMVAAKAAAPDFHWRFDTPDFAKQSYARLFQEYKRLGIGPQTGDVYFPEDLKALKPKLEAMPAMERVAEIARQYKVFGELGANAVRQLVDAGFGPEVYVASAAEKTKNLSQLDLALQGIKAYKTGENRNIEQNQAIRDTVLEFLGPTVRTSLNTWNPEYVKTVVELVTGHYTATAGNITGLNKNASDADRDLAVKKVHESLKAVLGVTPGGSGYYSYGQVDGVPMKVILPIGATASRFEAWQDNLTEDKLRKLSGNQVPFVAGKPLDPKTLAVDGILVFTGDSDTQGRNRYRVFVPAYDGTLKPVTLEDPNKFFTLSVGLVDLEE